LIEQCAIFREGLINILASTQFRIVMAAASGGALQKDCSRETGRTLVIIGAGENAAATAKELEHAQMRYPSARCVVLNTHSDLSAVAAALRAGAKAYLLKSIEKETLVKTLEIVMLGETVLPAAIVSLVCDDLYDRQGNYRPDERRITDDRREQVSHRLSPREIGILHCLSNGDSNKLIARRFTISEATVKVHVKAILRKIHVGNRTQAAVWAVDHCARRVAAEGVLDCFKDVESNDAGKYAGFEGARRAAC
jgi:two-component system nitrate/nitrite response regulator NarL